MFWLVLALLGAFFTSMTTILAKIGIEKVNSNFATFYRTGIVIICSLILCVISSSIMKIGELKLNNWIFIGLSGIATGCSWLCYYKALQLGNINKVAPIDKSSFILTSILFLIFFFQSTTKNGDILTIVMLIVSMILMLFGTLLMIGKNDDNQIKSSKWLVYAILSAVFASLVSFFIKLGLAGISSDLGTLLRTIVVFVFAGTIVLVRKDYKGTKQITKKSWLFLTLSGIATGGAWLCEYAALNIENVNPIAVNSIGKLSILLTMLFSFVILKEKFNKRSIYGLILLVIGIILIIAFSL
ncbi:MAG: EamA family transporter [Erysipelotrichales bacterium]|nr:EamA family transporter [Erysipelotrichales bacterium]